MGRCEKHLKCCLTFIRVKTVVCAPSSFTLNIYWWRGGKGVALEEGCVWKGQRRGGGGGGGVKDEPSKLCHGTKLENSRTVSETAMCSGHRLLHASPHAALTAVLGASCHVTAKLFVMFHEQQQAQWSQHVARSHSHDWQNPLWCKILVLMLSVSH